MAYGARQSDKKVGLCERKETNKSFERLRFCPADTSPCGPWTYYMVSERPWKEVDRLLAEEQRMGLARDGEAF